jgi:UDP-glucose:(heptosyl)LPS alpha-1,3-glucosyltransferase
LVQTYKLPLERIQVIPNGVDLDTFHPRNVERDRKRVRRELGVGDRPLLLFVGYEFERKGLPLLLTALPRLQTSDTHLVVVGRPLNAYAARLLRALDITHHVHFLGPRPEIAPYYAACDLFLFPTRYEPFGLVIAEAMASGIPVLTTTVAGAADRIHHGENGIVIDPPVDATTLAALIDDLLADPRKRQAMGAAGRATAEKHWSWRAIARQVLDLYRGLLAEGRA